MISRAENKAELVWSVIAPICTCAAIVWWFGPIAVAIFIVQIVVVVVVIGFPLFAIVWALTGGR